MNVRKNQLLLVAGAIVIHAACAPAPVPVGMPAPPARVVAPAADAEVVSVMRTANTAEIMTSQTAVQRASSSAVREFAQRMITDHTALNEQLSRLAIPPGPSTVATQLESNARQTVDVLQQLEGAAFDVAYMDNQIDLHEYTLSALDDYLIPSATDGALRAELQRARDIVASHLTQARQIRQSL